MSWFSRKPKKARLDVLRVPRVRFLGEQDGPTERELKRRLTDVFRGDQRVHTAYLARVAYDDGISAVSLCLRSQRDAERGLVEAAGSAFSSLFASDEHLDILFICDEQEAELIKVCRPFLSADGRTGSA